MYKTMQRNEILTMLQKKHKHLTATEVYDLLRDKVPQISLGTVYRNLELLAEKGIISQVKSYSKQKRFEANTKFHLHTRCPICDTIEDIEHVEQQIIDALAKLNCESYILEFINCCPICKEKLEKQKNLSRLKKQPLSLL